MRIFRRKKFKEAVIGYSFLLPNIIGFLILTATPVVFSLIMCFFERVYGEWVFVGWENFRNLLGFHLEAYIPVFERSFWYHIQQFLFPLKEGSQFVPNDGKFWQYLGNTVFLSLSIPPCIIGSLFVAIALNQKVKGRLFFRTAFFIPSLSSAVAIAFLWLAIYDPQYGLANVILRFIARSVSGIIPQLGEFQGIPWLNSFLWAKPAFIIMAIWGGIGGMNMMLYLAALQNIPSTLYEAAEIDGANWWHKFLRITWPMVSPTTFFIFVMSFIRGLQGWFLQALVLTAGGPAGATTTMSYYIVNNFYMWNFPGYACGVAWILFVMIFTITLLNWRFAGSRVHYE